MLTKCLITSKMPERTSKGKLKRAEADKFVLERNKKLIGLFLKRSTEIPS